jgi:hypothetical protein
MGEPSASPCRVKGRVHRAANSQAVVGGGVLL